MVVLSRRSVLEGTRRTRFAVIEEPQHLAHFAITLPALPTAQSRPCPATIGKWFLLVALQSASVAAMFPPRANRPDSAEDVFGTVPASIYRREPIRGDLNSTRSMTAVRRTTLRRAKLGLNGQQITLRRSP